MEMTEFEKIWYDKYINNLCTIETLNKLMRANKLKEDMINSWINERSKTKGY